MPDGDAPNASNPDTIYRRGKAPNIATQQQGRPKHATQPMIIGNDNNKENGAAKRARSI
jgi:hypothetical protein